MYPGVSAEEAVWGVEICGYIDLGLEPQCLDILSYINLTIYYTEARSENYQLAEHDTPLLAPSRRRVRLGIEDGAS